MADIVEVEGLKRRLEEGTAALGLPAREAVFCQPQENYQTLFDAIDEGFCIVEVLGGERGEPVDYRFLQTNASFERQTGLVNAVGERMRTLASLHEKHWFERYLRIAQTRTPERFEDRADALGRWYDVYAFPIGDPKLRRVGILFRDVMTRKLAERELTRANHLLQTTVDNSLQTIQLFKAVRDERDEIIDFEWLLTNKQWNDRWGSNVGKRLLTENPGVVESGVWDKFLQVMETGDPITHEHFYNYEQFDGWFLQSIAKAADGILLTTLDITERKNADLALRESEERFRAVFESIDEGVVTFDVIFDADGKAIDATYVENNSALRRMTGLTIDIVSKRMNEVVPNLEPFWFETITRVIKTGEPARFEYTVHDLEDQRFDVFASRVGGEGSSRIVLVYNNITVRKNAETALRESEERQSLLLKLSDALRPLADPAEIQNAAMRVLGQHLGVFRAQYFEAEGDGKHLMSVAGYPDPKETFVSSRIRMDDFGSFVAADLRAGKTVVMSDTAEDPRVNDVNRRTYQGWEIGAYVAVPLVKGDHFVVCVGVHSATPRDWTALEIGLIEETAERTWAAVERARAEAALRASEERFAQFAKASAAGLWIRDAATLAMEYVSPAILEIYGTDQDVIMGSVENWAGMIVPEDREAALQHVEEAKAGHSIVHEFRIQRPDDDSFRWIRNTDFPLGQNGHVERIGGIAEDVTEQKLLTEHQAVLLAELQHRVRNIMAVIRSIVERTAGGATSTADYIQLLSGRLLTLARVQALLTRAANAGVEMSVIINDELAAQATHAGQFAVAGPAVILSPKAAETMTLAVHELTTNALKYGALSAAGGKVEVSWDVVEKRRVPWLRFKWQESGSFPRKPSTPKRTGFGSELIEGRVPYELGGRGTLTIEPAGAQCHLEFPIKDGLSVLETNAPKRATIFGGAIDMSGHADLTGQKVLVVEDDYYLATDTARALKGAGAEVIGPCAAEGVARDKLADTSPTCAVLDINLRGGRSFDLARELKRAQVPFVFITGYDQEVIPNDLVAFRRLQKPVQFAEIVSALADTLGIDR